MANLEPKAFNNLPDDTYQTIIDMHEGLSKEESDTANAKLILILADCLGNLSLLKEFAQKARDNTLKWSKSK